MTREEEEERATLERIETLRKEKGIQTNNGNKPHRKGNKESKKARKTNNNQIALVKTSKRHLKEDDDDVGVEKKTRLSLTDTNISSNNPGLELDQLNARSGPCYRASDLHLSDIEKKKFPVAPEDMRGDTYTRAKGLHLADEVKEKNSPFVTTGELRLIDNEEKKLPVVPEDGRSDTCIGTDDPHLINVEIRKVPFVPEDQTDKVKLKKTRNIRE